MNYRLYHPKTDTKQKGVVLVISLIILLMLTLIGLSGTQSTGLQEKMAGNARDRNLAFQAAEAALSKGELVVTTRAFDCTNGRYKEMDKNCDNVKDTKPVWENINWSATADPLGSVEYTGGTLTKVSAKPRFIIEDLGPRDANGNGRSDEGGIDQHVYRITARATGGSEDAVVILQSIYEVPI